MKRYFFKEKSKRNRTDLTMIGREELIAPAIAQMRQRDLEFLMEDERMANIPPPPPPKPYVREKTRVWQVILSAINPKKYRP